MSLTPEQKAARDGCLGSSDAPVVCGVSSYSSPLELFHKMTGSLPRYDERDTLQQKIGSRLEPVIAEIAAEELNIKIRRIAGRVHPARHFMVAHADYEIVSNPKGPGLMEVKNRSGQKPWEALPDEVHLQIVHQLAVIKRPWALVAGLFQFGQLKTYEVERDMELEEYLIEIEARFYRHVADREPPDANWTPETIGILRKLYPQDSGKTICLPDQHALNCEGFLAAKRELDAIEEKKALYEGLLKEAVADATYATTPGFSISWKSTKPSQKFDLDQFKQEQPDLYQQYLKMVPGYRRFSVKPDNQQRRLE